MKHSFSKLLLAAAVTLIPFSALAEPKLIKFASFPPPPGALNKSVLGPWVKQINAKLAGKAEFKLFMGGSLGRNPVQQYKLVKDRVADLAYIVMAYTPGEFPDTSIFELPFLVNTALEGSLAHWQAYKKGILRGYDKVKVLGLFTIPPQSIHTKRPVKGIGDLKGMRIRAAGPYQSAALNILGATPVGRIPVPNVAQSINSGVVDGTLSDWNGMVAFRIGNVAKFHIEVPLGAAAGGILMNESVFNELPADVRNIIDQNSGESLSRLNGVEFDKRYNANIARAKKNKADDFIIPTSAQLNDLRKRLHPVTNNWIKKNPEGQKRYDAVEAILSDIRKK